MDLPNSSFFLPPFRRSQFFENEACVVTACLNFPLMRAVRLPHFCRSPHVGSPPRKAAATQLYIPTPKGSLPHASTSSAPGRQGQRWPSPGLHQAEDAKQRGGPRAHFAATPPAAHQGHPSVPPSLQRTGWEHEEKLCFLPTAEATVCRLPEGSLAWAWPTGPLPQSQPDQEPSVCNILKSHTPTGAAPPGLKRWLLLGPAARA